jgi:hypothetical protein
MEVNWTIITYIVIGYFALAGYSRGWWKEAVTTVFLVILLLFLQNPPWAEGLINFINQIIDTIWNNLPATIRPTINEGLTVAFATGEFTTTPQIDPSNPETWLVILALLVGVAILIGRLSFTNSPLFLGRVLGAIIGGFNGVLILSLVREYLDGRALPGQVASTSELRLVSGSDFGPPAPSVSIQATGLPDLTILDSVLPWIAIGLGAVFLFFLLTTRFRIGRSDDGRRLETVPPPLYQAPPQRPQRPRRVRDLLDMPF